jgi:branched-chain amino acid transport system ATP-binding protein
MLKINNIFSGYNEITILKGVSLEVNTGEIVALLGANGAGKSTMLKSILGIVRISSGQIDFLEKRIDNLSTSEIVQSGISLVFEGRRIFPELSVLENLVMGGYTSRNRAERDMLIENAFQQFPKLKERKNQVAGSLSGGEQQMLAIGRALMSQPKLLLLDEPSMGLAPTIVDDIFKIINDINNTGTTVLLVEQNAERALEIANRVYVLETGNIVLSDDAKNLIGNKDVQAAYLGG